MIMMRLRFAPAIGLARAHALAPTVRSRALRKLSLLAWMLLFALTPGVPTAAGVETPATTSAVTRASRGGRLVSALFSEPKHFNPLSTRDGATETVLRLTMADLVRIERDTQETSVNLARDWSVSDDGLVYTVELRAGVRFSDGHPLDADDVVFSFETYLDESVHSPQRELLIVGGEPVRVEKLDELRVAFHLDEPYAAEERLFDTFFILPEHVLGPLREKGELATAWSDPTKPSEIVGLGPFRVKELRAGERVVLERNPHYWKRDESGEPLPYLDEVVLEIFPSQEAAVLRFRAGELHVLERLEPRAFTELERNGGAQSPSPYRVMDLGAGLDHSFLFFNLNDSESDDPLAVEKTWFRDAEFRRAVSAAVDRDSIARLVYLGKASPLDTHVSPGNRHWYDPNASAPRYSLDDARERLAAASFRWDAEGRLLDAGGRRVELSILTSSSNEARKRIASIIVEDLRKLGIEATVVELEFRAYVSRIFENRDYDVVIAALGGGDTDPNPSTSILLSSGSMHMWRLGAREVAPWQAEIDRLMTEQLTVSDRARRRELYFRVQRLIAEHLPFIGVVSPHTLVGVARNLGNFRPGILRPHGLWNAEELYFVE